jgi:hypothetical protein
MRPVTTIGAAVFGLVAVAHLLRLIFNWEITIAGWAVPYWVSVLGLAVTAALSALLFREARQK